MSRTFFTFCTHPKTGCGLNTEAFLHVYYGTRFKSSPLKTWVWLIHRCGLYTDKYGSWSIVIGASQWIVIVCSKEIGNCSWIWTSWEFPSGHCATRTEVPFIFARKNLMFSLMFAGPGSWRFVRSPRWLDLCGFGEPNRGRMAVGLRSENSQVRIHTQGIRPPSRHDQPVILPLRVLHFLIKSAPCIRFQTPSDIARAFGRVRKSYPEGTVFFTSHKSSMCKNTREPFFLA